MRHLKLLLTFISIFIISGIFAQEETKDENEQTIIISGELRPRTEYYHGYKMPVVKEIMPGYKMPGAISTNQRTRFNLGFKSSKIAFGLSLQDVRTWGNQAQLVVNEDFATSVHQAWGEVFFKDEFSLKAGRMELAYDDHRILGSVGWAPQARSHDLALFKYEGKLKVHLGIAYHGGPYYGPDAYKAMQFLWINGKTADLGYSILALNNGKAERQVHHTNASVLNEYNAYSHTLGGRLTYKLGDLNIGLNAYYQTGKNNADWVDVDSLSGTLVNFNALFGTNYMGEKGQGQKINAYNIGLDLMYLLFENVKIGAAYEMISGNDLTDLSRVDQNAFAPLYGTNHKFNGWMDYFFVGNHAGSVGLQDISLRLIYTNGPFFLKIFPHYFMPAGKAVYLDSEGNDQNIAALGTEIDIWAGYNIIPKVASIEFGYSHMFGTESMYGLKYGVSPASEDFGMNNWAWLMLTVKPNWKSN